MAKLSWRIIIPLTLTFFLFAFLRFSDLGHRAGFGWDQEQFSNQIMRLVEEHKPSLLGPRVNNDKGFFLAPYFTYILTPFYLLTGLHPNGMFIFQILINSGFFFSSFAVVSKLFSYRHALFFVFLWTISAMLTDLETVTWWPILIPPGIMLLWLLESKIYKNPKSLKLWAIAGITAGLFINMHFQFIFVLAQFGLFALLLKSKSKLNKVKNLAVFLVTFLLMLTPLFIFDIRNNFLNSHLFFNYFFIKNAIQSATYFDWPVVLSLMLSPYIIIKSQLAGILVIVGLFCATTYLHMKTTGFKSVFYLSNLGMILITPVAFSMIGMRPSEYYFLYLTPLFLIVLVDLFLVRKMPLPLLGLCAALAVLNIPSLQLSLDKNYGSLQYKDDVIRDIKKRVGGKKFFISFDGPPGTDGGFRYLIKVYELNSSSDGKNPQIRIFPTSPDSRKPFGSYEVIIPEELER